MRFIWLSSVLLLAILTGCDPARIYEQNTDLTDRHWLATDTLTFTFTVADSTTKADLYANLRTTINYPWSRIFLSYTLEDSANTYTKDKLIQAMLFDPKSGAPDGESVLGDIYSYRIPLQSSFPFSHPGPYHAKLVHIMRTDTLEGIVSVGVRVESGN